MPGVYLFASFTPSSRSRPCRPIMSAFGFAPINASGAYFAIQAALQDPGRLSAVTKLHADDTLPTQRGAGCRFRHQVMRHGFELEAKTGSSGAAAEAQTNAERNTPLWVCARQSTRSGNTRPPFPSGLEPLCCVWCWRRTHCGADTC